MILHIGFIPDMRRLNWHRSHAFSRLNLWLPFKIATSLTIPAAIRCLWQDRTKIKTTRRLKSQCSFPKHKVEKKPKRIKVMKVWECNGVWKFMSTVIMADLKKKKIPMQMSIRRHMMYRWADKIADCLGSWCWCKNLFCTPRADRDQLRRRRCALLAPPSGGALHY